MSFASIAKPVGAACNLACSYCFFRDRGTPGPTMSDAVMRAYVDQAAETGSVVWQGGEPTLAGLDFYRRVVAHLGSRRLSLHAIQTNGVLIGDEWAAFLAEHRILVGVSVDGPQAVHDRNRRGHDGLGSWRAAVRCVRALQRAGAEFNVLSTVNEAGGALQVYRHLRDDLGATHMQFIPVGCSGPRWGEFLVSVLDASTRDRVFVANFDAPTCSTMPTCGRCPVVDRDGDVYSCDHYVTPEHRLGNVLTGRIADMLDSPAQRAFGRAKATAAACSGCPALDICHGECPRTRGSDGRSRYCEGYRALDAHLRLTRGAARARG